MIKFIDNSKEIYIRNLIRKNILPNLNYDEFDYLIKFLYILIELICVKYAINPENYQQFWIQLQQNNNRDIVALFNILLPYIDDVGGSYKLHKSIYKLSDISNKKDPFNKDKTLITNTIYNLYDGADMNKDLEDDRYYNKSILKDNFMLLIETINQTSNKLFVNWLNIRPITLSDYKDSYLYKSSIKFYEDSNVQIQDNSRNYILRLRQNNITSDVILYKKYFAFEEDHVEINKEVNNNKKYMKIKNNLNNLSDINLEDESIFRNKGIYIGDIFNTLYYDLYKEIVNIKWLIYQNIFDVANHDEIYIKKFNEYISIPGLYNNTKWSELEDSEQNKFINRWDSFLNKVKIYNNSIDSSDLTDSINGFFNMLKNIIIFFEKNYNRLTSLINKYNYKRITQKNKLDLIDDIEENNFYKISCDDLLNRIKVIPYEDLYNYFLDTIQKFIVTWYGRNIVKFDNLGSKSEVTFNYDSYFSNVIKKDFFNKEYGYNLLPEDISIKYKYIYNYAKTFFVEYYEKNLLLKSDWSNMNPKIKLTILNKLNLSNIESSTNYYNIFKKIYSEDSALCDIRNCANYIGNIFVDDIRKNLVNITFEALIYKGLLNELVFDSRLTDKEYLSKGEAQGKQNNQINNLSKIVFTPSNLDNYKNNAYYFLTNKKYGKLYDYFDKLISKYKWYTYYSMDWVSQINFFHRFINNRVIYITGATGQGKSTQIPKLFLYALKMISKINNGKIGCSQPRINPTIENSEQISSELGVPISTTNNKNEKLKGYNQYVQYKTQKDNHTVNTNNDLVLELLTDKLLYMKLIRYPIFKITEEKHNKNNAGESPTYDVYTPDNVYDIIMVDESHEHNVNMDLILTLARDTVQFNNSLKLVIISATMDDDEPIYRRYYKEINDNFSHPFNFFNSHHNFDRNSIDRRIHISPPGQTTQYNIYEKYLDIEPTNYSEAESFALKEIYNLTSKPLDGDILVFSLGKKEIKELCKTINSNLSSPDIICLPFYRELPERWKIFNDLANNLNKITIDRISLFDDIENKKTNILNVPIGTYKRAIIIATNIAEASITINTLKYVIDIGYYYKITYDPITMKSIPTSQKISESSRVQRKGRIGRVSSGNIYYMYTLDSRKYIPNEYKICISDISSEIYDILAKKNSDPKILGNYNFSLFENIGSKYNYDHISDTFLIDNKLVYYLILKQYTHLSYILPSVINLITKIDPLNIIKIDNITIINSNLSKQSYSTFNFNSEKVFNLISNRNIRLITGYYHEDINDFDGKFYIIHPYENKLNRNKISGVLKENNNLEIIDVYLKKSYVFGLIYKTQIDYATNNYVKITSGLIIQNIIKNYFPNSFDEDDENINRSFVYTLVYTYASNDENYDNNNIVIFMILLLRYSNYSLSNLNKNYKFFKELYNDSQMDDLYIYYRLAKSIYSKLHKFEQNINQNNISLFENQKRMYLKQKQKIINNDMNLDIDKSIYDEFNKLDNINKLDINKNITDFLKTNYNDYNIEQFYDVLKSLSIELTLDNANSLYKKYLNIKNEYNRLINFNNDPNSTNDLLWFKYYLPIEKSNDQFTNIKKAFVYGFGPLNTCIYKPKTNTYDNIVTLESYKLASDSLTNTNQYIVYLNNKYDKININISSNSDNFIKCNTLNLFQDYINLQPIISKIHDDNNFVSLCNTKTISNPTFYDLYTLPNNLNKYIIKGWYSILSDVHHGMIGMIGGSNNRIIKYRLSKLLALLNKSHIDIDSIKINNHIYIDQDYIYLTEKN